VTIRLLRDVQALNIFEAVVHGCNHHRRVEQAQYLNFDLEQILLFSLKNAQEMLLAVELSDWLCAQPLYAAIWMEGIEDCFAL